MRQQYEKLCDKDTATLISELKDYLERILEGDCDLHLVDAYLAVLDEKAPLEPIDVKKSLRRFKKKYADWYKC